MTQAANAPNSATANPTQPRRAEPPNPPPAPDAPAAPNAAEARPATLQNPPAPPPPDAAPNGPNAAPPTPAQPTAPAAAPAPPPAASANSNGAEVRPAEPAPAPAKPAVPRKPLPENVAAALSYLLGWVSGLGFLLVDRRPFVRYHAAQSVVVFATLSVLLLVLGDFFLGNFLPHADGVLLALRRIVELVWLVSAIALMLKASTGERTAVPGAGPEAERAAASKPGRRS